MDQLLAKWQTLKQEISKLTREEEAIKTKIKTVMKTRKLATFRTEKFRVVLRDMSRESLSKKECPPEVWSKYCKKSAYSMIRLESLGDELEEPEQDIE